MITFHFHLQPQYKYELFHINFERSFPQAKLDSEVNVRFLLNEPGDLYVLLHNNSVHIVLLSLKEN